MPPAIPVVQHPVIVIPAGLYSQLCSQHFSDRLFQAILYGVRQDTRLLVKGYHPYRFHGQEFVTRIAASLKQQENTVLGLFVVPDSNMLCRYSASSIAREYLTALHTAFLKVSIAQHLRSIPQQQQQQQQQQQSMLNHLSDSPKDAMPATTLETVKNVCQQLAEHLQSIPLLLLDRPLPPPLPQQTSSTAPPPMQGLAHSKVGGGIVEFDASPPHPSSLSQFQVKLKTYFPSSLHPQNLMEKLQYCPDEGMLSDGIESMLLKELEKSVLISSTAAMLEKSAESVEELGKKRVSHRNELAWDAHSQSKRKRSNSAQSPHSGTANNTAPVASINWSNLNRKFKLICREEGVEIEPGAGPSAFLERLQQVECCTGAGDLQNLDSAVVEALKIPQNQFQRKEEAIELQFQQMEEILEKSKSESQQIAILLSIARLLETPFSVLMDRLEAVQEGRTVEPINLNSNYLLQHADDTAVYNTRRFLALRTSQQQQQHAINSHTSSTSSALVAAPIAVEATIIAPETTTEVTEVQQST